MNNLKGVINYVVFNLGYAVLLYLGTYEGISGFMNIIAVFTWAMFFLYALSCNNSAVQSKIYLASKNSLSFTPFGYFLNFVFLCVLAFYGHFILVIVDILTTFVLLYMQEEGKKLEGSASS